MICSYSLAIDFSVSYDIYATGKAFYKGPQIIFTMLMIWLEKNIKCV